MQYSKADIFIICVASNSQDSFESVEKWEQEIRTVIPDAPIIIALTKKDLLQYLENPVTKAMVQAKKNERLF